MMPQANSTGASRFLPIINRAASENYCSVNHAAQHFVKPCQRKSKSGMEQTLFGVRDKTLFRERQHMKTQMIKAAILGSVIASLGLGATSAQAATATATARAKILRQVTVTNSTDLQFGTIVTGTAPSTVIVSTLGARTCGAGLVCSGVTTAAAFAIGGTTGQIVTISVPATVQLDSGTNNMIATLTSSAATATMVANAGAFTVGGTLTVGADQADGDYAGNFIATVNYQ
jgi:Mat/Ecp fimbriae major subunit